MRDGVVNYYRGVAATDVNMDCGPGRQSLAVSHRRQSRIQHLPKQPADRFRRI